MTFFDGRAPMTGGPVGLGPRGVADVLAERDAIQANLLELDGSFVKRMLDGAVLTGQTKERWASSSAALAGLWETYLAYSAVVDRIAELGSGARRPSKKDQPELTGLLTGGCVQLPAAPAPLGRRDLASTGRPPVTLVVAVATMRRAFAQVTEVTAAVESVWAAVGGPLDAVAAELARCRPLVAGLGDEIEAAFRASQAAVDSQRAALNADPLALWSAGPAPPGQRGRVDTSAVARLQEQVAALTPRIAELDGLRAQGHQRIDALAAAAAVARSEREDAVATWHRASTRIAALPPLPPDIAEPSLRSLAALAAGGWWSRLRAELDRCEAELAASAAQTQEVRQLVVTAVDRREELRGLLGAYKAKAARLGAAEDLALVARYEQAYDLLRAVPCDLAAVFAAVSDYQQAILATEGQR